MLFWKHERLAECSWCTSAQKKVDLRLPTHIPASSNRHPRRIIAHFCLSNDQIPICVDDGLDQCSLAGPLRDRSLRYLPSRHARLRSTWDDTCRHLSYLEPRCHAFDLPRALFFDLRRYRAACFGFLLDVGGRTVRYSQLSVGMVAFH